MKTSTKILLALLMPVCFICNRLQAQNTFPSTGAAGIGTTTPDASSLLEIKSSAKGILIPRMSQVKRDAIVSPAMGLLIYQTNSTPGFYYYDGTVWKAVSNGANTSLSNLTAPTAVNKSLIPGTTGTLNLGSSANLWRNAYFSGDAYVNGLTIGLGNGASGSNTALGYQALNTNTTGTDNTAVGYQALQLNTSGSYNVATGVFALHSNINGGDNNAYGNAALTVNISGSANNAFGFYSLYANSTGNYNSAYGDRSLYSNSSGNNNSGFGTNALYSNSTSNNNSAFGMNALYSNSTGYSNVAMGVNTLFKNQTGSNLVAIGDSALYNQNGGSGMNTAVGSKALFANTVGSYNTANGNNALYSNTTGVDNTASGFQALYSNTSGYTNSANGYQSLYSNTTGGANTATGSAALYANLTGFYNTANGEIALRYNTTGSFNTASGALSLFQNTTGYSNTATGAHALFANTTGHENTANGEQALFQNTTGYYNTALGLNALYSNITGNYNTAIGIGADVTATDLENAMALGYYADVNASNKVIVGNTAVTVIGGQVGWSTFSDGRFKNNIKENVPGLAFINKLKPVTYNLELKKFDKFLGKKDSIINSREKNYVIGQKKIHTGFVAQDVEKAAQELKYDFDGVNHPQNDKDNYSLVYADFVPSLVKAVQELSKTNDDKDAKIADLEQRLSKLETMMNAQQSSSANYQSETINNADALLKQNTPNPFSNNTIIRYYIPAKANNAQLIISDVNGRILKTFALTTKENGQTTIAAGSFSQGNYFYSLMIDGKKSDTKQMVLTK